MRSSQHSFWRAEGTRTHPEHMRTPLPLFVSLLLHCRFGSFLPTGHLLAHSCSRAALQLQSFLKRHKTWIWKREQNTPEPNGFSRHFPALRSTKRDGSVGYNQHMPSGASHLLLHGKKKPLLPSAYILIFYKLKNYSFSPLTTTQKTNTTEETSKPPLRKVPTNARDILLESSVATLP